MGLDDDGDYFTWTRDEAAAVLTAEELEVAAAYYDIGTAGEMHHNPGQERALRRRHRGRSSPRRLGRPAEDIRAALERARGEAPRRPGRAPRAVRRPHPLRQLERDDGVGHARARARCWATRTPRRHALLTLERLRRRARGRGRRGAHAGRRDRPAGRPGPGRGGRAGRARGHRRRRLAHLGRSGSWTGCGPTTGTRRAAGCSIPRAGGRASRVSCRPRAKPVQDAPTPSPNGVAGIVCARLHELTGDARWRERGLALLRAFAGRAGELALYAAAYLLAVDWHSVPGHASGDRRRAGRSRRRPDARRRAGRVRAPPGGPAPRARRRRGPAAAAGHGRHGGGRPGAAGLCLHRRQLPRAGRHGRRSGRAVLDELIPPAT